MAQGEGPELNPNTKKKEFSKVAYYEIYKNQYLSYTNKSQIENNNTEMQNT
jgi:hypothetical protein